MLYIHVYIRTSCSPCLLVSTIFHGKIQTSRLDSIRIDHFSRVSRVSGRSVIVKRLSILGEIVFGVYRKWVRRGWSSLAC